MIVVGAEWLKNTGPYSFMVRCLFLDGVRERLYGFIATRVFVCHPFRGRFKEHHLLPRLLLLTQVVINLRQVIVCFRRIRIQANASFRLAKRLVPLVCPPISFPELAVRRGVIRETSGGGTQPSQNFAAIRFVSGSVVPAKKQRAAVELGVGIFGWRSA